MKKPQLTLRQDDGRMKGPLLSFILGALCALAIFIPFLIIDKGMFIYVGDYIAQQIPFYKYVQGFLQQGGGTWSWATDLGSSVVTAYSFYNIGSPFLWGTLLFPNSWMPFLMVPLFVLKFGSIAAAANLFLSRYAKNRNAAVALSLVYAFCGFNVYNIFFNHMLDAVLFFPLMLWALDGYMYERKRGWFALFVGLALLNSYFFFIGNVVFLLIYFTVKIATEDYVITPKDFAFLALEALLGVGIGMALALPSFLSLMNNPRTSNFAEGFGLLQYGNVQQYFEIVSSMFLPPDPPYLPNLFTEGAIKWTSMSAFLPIVSIAGVIAYFRGRKKSAMKIILVICFIMALVPILNSSFYAFNASYYARWYYMPILIMCFMTMQTLEDESFDLLFAIKVTFGLTAVWAIYGLIPNGKEPTVDGQGFGSSIVAVWNSLGVAKYPSKFWATIFVALLGIGIFYVIVKAYRRKVRFMPILISAIMGFSVFYSVYHISITKFPQWESDLNYMQQQYYGTSEIVWEDEQFFRTDSYRTYDNIGLWIDKSNLQTFNSVVNPSIMEFYPFLGVKRDVSSKPERWVYGLRGLLSVKYTITPVADKEAFELATGEGEYQGNKGWALAKEEGGFAFYENDNYVPMGFTYDSYITMDNLTLAQESDRSLLLMRAIGLDDEQVEKYGYLFTDGSYGTYSTSENDDGEETETFTYPAISYEEYVKDATNRRRNASYNVTAGASGLVSNILLDKESMVFYSIPYDKGFSATVNGEPVEVLKVSSGMTAVVAPAGDNEIVFTYRTPGFRLGIVITLLCFAILIAYVVWFRMKKKKALANLPEGASLQEEVLPLPKDGVPSEKAVARYNKIVERRKRARLKRLEKEQLEQQLLAQENNKIEAVNGNETGSVKLDTKSVVLGKSDEPTEDIFPKE